MPGRYIHKRDQPYHIVEHTAKGRLLEHGGNYWTSTLRNRVAGVAPSSSRAAPQPRPSWRRGGSNSSSSSGDAKGSSDKSGLVTKSVDTSKEAKRGGTLRWFQENEPAHSTYTPARAAHRINQLVNSNLVNEKPGIIGLPEFSEVVLTGPVVGVVSDR